MAVATDATGCPINATHGDEERSPNRLGSFSKTLPHDARGEVDWAAYQRYLDVLQSGDEIDR